MGNRVPGKNSAVISDDGLYRYQLTRKIEYGEDEKPPHLHQCIFVMLNPSTADATEDDATIRRCMAFAKAEGARQLTVVNLYAGRATKPEDLFKMDDPVGPENDAYLADVLSYKHDAVVIVAWGAKAKADRVAEFMALANKPGAKPLYCLQTNKDGEPGHPLYLKGDTATRRWPVVAEPEPEQEEVVEEQDEGEPGDTLEDRKAEEEEMAATDEPLS